MSSSASSRIAGNRISRAHSALGIVFLALLLGLAAAKRFHAPAALSQVLLTMLCFTLAAGSVTTLMGFHFETRGLAAAHRRSHSPVRLALQWLVFAAAAAVLVIGVVLFSALAMLTLLQLFRA